MLIDEMIDRANRPMNNAELVKALRVCADCTDLQYGTGRERCTISLMRDAADALEAADRRIAELIEAVANRDRLADDLNKYIRKLETQLPKEGEWKKILQNDDGTSDYQCSACLGIIMDVPDDDEHPLCSFCPNCGAQLKTVTDCHTLEDGERC